MDPETVVAALRKNAVLVALHVVLGAVLGLALGLLTPPVYTSTASANVGTEQPDSSQTNDSVLNYMKNIMPTLVEMGTSEAALSQVAEATGLSEDEVRRSVTISTKTETIIIEIQASHSDPGQAQAIAEAEVAALDSAARDLSERSQNSDLTLTLAVLDAASLPSTPSSLPSSRTTMIGAAVGLAAGTGMALLLYVLQRRDPEAHTIAPLVLLGRPRDGEKDARSTRGAGDAEGSARAGEDSYPGGPTRRPRAG
ncbi:YveK family protein [Actinomyces wuliandei]|uniref:YveK family protein n=1 Tax=Actinomyces wuliandei TaxID=2057743 RepID=UPI000FDC0FD4|nr:Wzz/FepE/Etk N-terminal domain-containing protein [Actinomyces wuliandei]